MEVAGRWRDLPSIYEATVRRAAWRCPAPSPPAPTSRTRTPTAPASTSPSPARSSPTSAPPTTRALWDAGQRAALAAGAALSHHHGVGLARSRYVAEALGASFAVLQAVKAALDPNGILNPGKLGLADPWGEVAW